MLYAILTVLPAEIVDKHPEYRFSRNSKNARSIRCFDRLEVRIMVDNMLTKEKDRHTSPVEAGLTEGPVSEDSLLRSVSEELDFDFVNLADILISIEGLYTITQKIIQTQTNPQ